MNLISDEIKIIPFQDKYAKIFKQLNLEWLKRYELFEPADLKYLEKPRQIIIEPGGGILMAVMNEIVVGTCAIVREDDKTAELAKLSVSPDIQGKGIGRMLIVESIKAAREMGFKKLILVSNKKLATAVRLYESIGFKHAPVPDDTIYKTADVYMERRIA